MITCPCDKCGMKDGDHSDWAQPITVEMRVVSLTEVEWICSHCLACERMSAAVSKDYTAWKNPYQIMADKSLDYRTFVDVEGVPFQIPVNRFGALQVVSSNSATFTVRASV